MSSSPRWNVDSATASSPSFASGAGGAAAAADGSPTATSSAPTHVRARISVRPRTPGPPGAQPVARDQPNEHVTVGEPEGPPRGLDPAAVEIEALLHLTGGKGP